MYTVNSIRNICLLGHSGSGKTALAESLLYMTGAIDRIGKNADGNTVCDYDPEEIRRHISISTSVVPLEYHNVKINLLDTPGAFDFSGAVMEALRAADAAILVCSAKDGITVGFEKAWKYCEDRNMPRFVYISKVDEDNSDYNATFNALREKYGNKIAPVVVPIWNSAHKVTGIIDVLNKRAYEMQNLKRVEIDVPADKVSVIEEFNDALKEAVAETDEALMDRFFEGGDFTYREMITGLHQGVKDLSLFPVLCGSGLTCLGSLMLMDNIIDLLPNPVQGNYHKATTADGKTEEFVVSPGGVPCAYVWKTVSDQYGKYSYVKVLSGEITSGYDSGQRPHRRDRKARQTLHHVRQEVHGSQGSGLRRHRRHRQDGQGPHRRHPVRPQKGRLPEADPLPRSLLFHGHRPQGEGSGRQGRHRPEPSERGRSLLHPDQQRRDQAAGHLRHRRSAAGRAGLQAEEPLRRGRRAVVRRRSPTGRRSRRR